MPKEEWMTCSNPEGAPSLDEVLEDSAGPGYTPAVPPSLVPLWSRLYLLHPADSGVSAFLERAIPAYLRALSAGYLPKLCVEEDVFTLAQVWRSLCDVAVELLLQ
ncbi:hypothetical protein GJAV_G00045410 [Gymnothorax javanicus]|nr:hypothetical protein GJAV_G00045410 [Gymnothorax javanicus]